MEKAKGALSVEWAIFSLICVLEYLWLQIWGCNGLPAYDDLKNFLNTVYSELFGYRDLGLYSCVVAETRLFLCMSLLLLSGKATLIYIWMLNNPSGVYRYFVVTPLTTNKPGRGENFINHEYNKAKGFSSKYRERSKINSLVVSFLSFMLCALIVSFVVWNYVVEIMNIDSPAYEINSKSGLNRWLMSSVYMGVAFSMFGSILMFIVKDTIILIERKLSRKK